MSHTDIILIFIAAMVIGAAMMMVGMVLLMVNKKDPVDYDSNTFFISYRDKNQLGLDGGEIRVYKYGELVNTISGRMADDICRWLTEVDESGTKTN